MITTKNRRSLLAAHPQAMPEAGDWRLADQQIKEAGAGEQLVRLAAAAR